MPINVALSVLTDPAYQNIGNRTTVTVTGLARNAKVAVLLAAPRGTVDVYPAAGAAAGSLLHPTEANAAGEAKVVFTVTFDIPGRRVIGATVHEPNANHTLMGGNSVEVQVL